MKETIKEILLEINLINNPYFVNLQNGQFDKDDFIETQIQFYFAVIFFSRPMSALAAKIPHANLRLEILKNVWEEHGEGDLKKAHSNSFIQFLEHIGNISPQEIKKTELWPEVRIFNTCLSGACILDDYMVGVAMMGMIERMFCEISTIIGQASVQRGWLTNENLVHYDLHAELDIKHSEDFFNVVSEAYKKNEENRYHIEQGLQLGATLFYNLYKELYNKRQKRAKRIYLGPHSRAQGVS